MERGWHDPRCHTTLFAEKGLRMSASPGGCGVRVLVVDDDILVREALRMILVQASYEVATAGDGAEALGLIDVWHPSAVVTDIVMPQDEGLRLIFEARRTRPRLAIVAMSGARAGTYLPLAQKLGADAVLAKPFDQNTVLTKVAGALADRLGQ